MLTTVSDTITGELHCARWNGETISEEEVPKLRTGIRCPRCARKLDPDKSPVIQVGGLR